MPQQPQQPQTIGLGKAFGIFLSTLVAVVMFIPRLVGSANKALDMVDDVLESGKSITTTMKESAEDYRNTAKLEADATYKQRLTEINNTRKAQGLDEVQVNTTRTLSPAAEAALAKLQGNP